MELTGSATEFVETIESGSQGRENGASWQTTDGNEGKREVWIADRGAQAVNLDLLLRLVHPLSLLEISSSATTSSYWVFPIVDSPLRRLLLPAWLSFFAECYMPAGLSIVLLLLISS